MTTATRPMCRHCCKRKVSRPKGLCWTCYFTAGVRELYPSTSKFCRRGPADFHHSARLAVPTDADPGSEEKLFVLEQRANKGASLFHPHDPQVNHSGGMRLVFVRERQWRESYIETKGCHE